jgi:LysR family nitrogen assimilation transcriptional regulator
MNLHQLRLFCTLVEKGSFTSASEELYIAQPSLSIQIRRLETSVGLKLVHRRAGGVVLTDAGREVYSTAKAIFEQTAALEHRLSGFRAGSAGNLAVGVAPTGVLYYLSELLSELTMRYPAVRVAVSVDLAEGIYDAVRQRRIDVALDWGPRPPAGLELVPLGEVEYSAVVAPRHPLASQTMLPLAAVTDTPFIALQHQQGVPSLSELALLQAGLKPRVAMRLPSIDAVKRMVEAGLGFSILSHLSIAREVSGGFLRALPIEGMQLRREVAVLLVPGGQSPLVERFLEVARETAQRQFANERRA